MPNGLQISEKLMNYHLVAVDIGDPSGRDTWAPIGTRGALLRRIIRESINVKVASWRKLLRATYRSGMVLGFSDGAEQAILLALTVQGRLKQNNLGDSEKKRLSAQIGLHTGGVLKIKDVNGRDNFFGPGVPIAIRIACLGRTDQILASKEFIDNLVKENPEYILSIKQEVQWPKKNDNLPTVHVFCP